MEGLIQLLFFKAVSTVQLAHVRVNTFREIIPGEPPGIVRCIDATNPVDLNLGNQPRQPPEGFFLPHSPVRS
jgi:hypothetical protein